MSIYLRKTISVFFEYDTPRYVHINSKKVGIFSRLIQFVILAYIIGYVLVYQKSYQDIDYVDSTIVTKVKGVAMTNYTSAELNVINPELYNRIWDSVDSDGNENGFFILTNVVVTPNQTRGICPEDPKILESVCIKDSDCKLNYALEIGNGVQTGRCVKSRVNGTKTCEINAWCPVEVDILPLNSIIPLLSDSKNFTVLIKNSISFSKFGPQFTRRNVLEDSNLTYLQTCNYDESNPFCPVFKIGDIVGSGFDEIGIKGAVYSIKIKWDCNLDWNFLDYCRPVYSFERKDNPKALIAPGWNFRSATYHEENRRTLYKKYGIKFIITVEGQAGKFSVIPLMLNVGSGLALMGLATIFCDLIVLYFLKSGKLYKTKKYLNVRGDDAFDVDPRQTQQHQNNYSRMRDGEINQNVDS